VASCHDEDGDEEGGNEKAAQPETTHVGGSNVPATLDGQLLDDVEEDEVSSLARSDILITPLKSDEEYEVANRAKCVTKTYQFEDVDMEDPHLSAKYCVFGAIELHKLDL
jgi:hypothetical protein